MENKDEKDTINKEKINKLMIFCVTNKKDEVETILEKNNDLNLNVKNSKGFTCLHLASSRGYKDIVSLLLKKGANILEKDMNGNTALHLASLNGHYDVVNRLIEESKKIEMLRIRKTSRGYHLCISKKENLDNVVSKIEKNYNQEIQKKKYLDDKNDDGCTALQLAYKNNHKRIVKLLIDSGALINSNDFKNIMLVDFIRNKEEITKNMLEHIQKEFVEACKCNKKEKVESVLKLNKGVIPKSILGECIFYAIISNSIYILDLLLQNGADVNATDERDRTPIFWVIDKNILLKLIKKNANLNWKDKEKNTVLFCNCALGCYEDIVKTLLENGANINEKNGADELTALHVSCCSKQNFNMVKILVDHNARVDIKDKKGNTVVHVCCETGNRKSLEYILKNKNVDLNLKNNKGNTPLHVAIGTANEEIVEVLTQYEINLNIKNSEGMYPLELAIIKNNRRIQELIIDNILIRVLMICQNGGKKDLDLVIDEKLRVPVPMLDYFLAIACDSNNIEIAKIFIEKGANVNEHIYVDEHKIRRQGIFVRSKENRKLLHIAAKKGYVEMVKLLLQSGANIMSKDKFGDTALDLAKREERLDVIDILIEELNKNFIRAFKNKDTDIDTIRDFVKQDVNINLEDEFKNTSIVYACKNGRLDLVEYFLDNGINLKYDKHIKTMLLNACDSDNADVLKCLIKNGANINTLYKNKMTLLMYACKNGKFSVVKYLTTNYCVNKSDKLAIMCAVQSNNLDVVKYLLDVGFDINCKDDNFMTILMCACKLGHKEIVKYLLDSGAYIHDIDSLGNNALAYAIKFACKDAHKDIVKYFIKHKLIDDEYMLQACCSIREVRGDIQTFVLKYVLGKIINKSDDKKRNNSLMYICEKGNLELLKLVNTEYIINCIDDKKETMLMKACQFGYCDIVKYLVHSGDDIKRTDIVGNNALSYAAMFGYYDIVKYLVEESKKDVLFVEHKNEYGVTPFIYACDMLKAWCKKNDSREENECEKAQIDIIKYLAKNGAIVSAVAVCYDNNFENYEIKNYIMEIYSNLCKKRHGTKNVSKCNEGNYIPPVDINSRKNEGILFS